MPAKNLIEFILYLTPGFIALELYRAAYPAKERNQFAQIAWSVILGVIIFTFVNWVDEHFLNHALYSNSAGFPAYRFIIALYITGLSVGGVRIVFHWMRFRISMRLPRLRFIAPDPQSIWAKINERTNEDWAVVFLDDSSIYLGWISNYTYNPNAISQDFLLSRAKRVDDNLKTMYIVDGQGVYLNTQNVKRIEFVKGG